MAISLGGLFGGNDRELAQTHYPDRPPATTTALAANRRSHFRDAKKADAQGAAWEAGERKKDRWWR
jgi:hypothetical protein